MSQEVNLKSVDAMFASVLLKLEQSEQRLVEIQALLVSQEKRIKDLEETQLAYRSKIIGGVAALSTVVGIIGWVVQQTISHLFTRP
jgi:hypothetical protein